MIVVTLGITKETAMLSQAMRVPVTSHDFNTHISFPSYVTAAMAEVRAAQRSMSGSRGPAACAHTTPLNGSSACAYVWASPGQSSSAEAAASTASALLI